MKTSDLAWHWCEAIAHTGLKYRTKKDRAFFADWYIVMFWAHVVYKTHEKRG